MTERERLIELLEKKSCAFVPCENECHGCHNVEMYGDQIEAIADYLLANGVIVPPCKVGDTVYRIVKLLNGETKIVEGEVLEIAISHEHHGVNECHFYFWAKGEVFTRRHYSIWCDFVDFGKTVFLTREEAEKALEAKQNDKK